MKTKKAVQAVEANGYPKWKTVYKALRDERRIACAKAESAYEANVRCLTDKDVTRAMMRKISALKRVLVGKTIVSVDTIGNDEWIQIHFADGDQISTRVSQKKFSKLPEDAPTFFFSTTTHNPISLKKYPWQRPEISAGKIVPITDNRDIPF